MEKIRYVGLIVLVLFNFLTKTSTQYQQFYRRTVRNEMRIKLPSDIAFTHDNHGNIEGEMCYNLIRRVHGICTLPNQCPEAILDFKKGIQPQICNYKGHLPIICCPRQEMVTKPYVQEVPTPTVITTRYSQPHTTEIIIYTTSTPIEPSTTTTSQVFYNPGPRISVQKCNEYMKLSIEENVVTTLSLNPENTPVEKSKCRKLSSGGLIVGGTKTEPGEFAHMAAIGWPQEDSSNVDWNCGGSLISYQFVLSAAHCVSWRGIKPKLVRLGDQNLRQTTDVSEPQEFIIIDAIRHPDYKTSSKYNDIALFKLDRRVHITDFVRPACLWQSFNVNYTSAIVTGWGLTKDRGKPSDELLKVSLQLTSNERCNTFFERFTALKNGIIDSQLCAGHDHEEKDSCNGDSGGPIQVATKNSACSYHIIGVTSFGKGCGHGYGVYTRVSQYIDWIESIVWRDPTDK